MKPPFRVFISVPFDSALSRSQLAFKHRIIELVRQAGFDPVIFGEIGVPPGEAWTLDNVRKTLSTCQGVIILGLTRWECDSARYLRYFITEYSHCEGAMGHVLNLPMLLFRQGDVEERGVLSANAAKKSAYHLPPKFDVNMINNDPTFNALLNNWKTEVSERSHVFLGYSSSSRATAVEIKSFLQGRDVRVMDWKTDFRPGKSVMERIQEAERRCMGGIFLFMKDDQVLSNGVQVDTPRDNVIFEAGYFMNTKGSERTLLICETGVKILSDLKGVLYLELKDRHDISSIEDDLRTFIDDNF